MSVAIHRDEDPGSADASGWRRHLVVAAAVLATLAVVAGPGLASLLGSLAPVPPVVEEIRLSEHAQRVLEELPGAYVAGSTVIVPAETDPFVRWPVAAAVASTPVDLGVRGLVEYGTLPASPDRPAWVAEVGPGDGVFSEVGSLSFACTEWPAEATCSGAVLTRHQQSWQVFQPALGPPGVLDPVMRFTALGPGGRLDVWLGWMPEGATTAWATVVGRQWVRALPAQTSRLGKPAGGSVWWLASDEPVSAVEFRDARGKVITRMPVRA